MKPKKVTSYPDQGYPSIHELTCERRDFLRRLVVGAVSVGVGSRLLAACTPTSEGLVGHVVGSELITVRLPGEGTAGVYLSDWYGGYLVYRVVFTTYSEQLAGYYQVQPSMGLQVAGGVLSTHSCSDMWVAETVREMEGAIKDAFVAHHRDVTGDLESEIHTLSLEVVSCESTDMPDGGADMPDYP